MKPHNLPPLNPCPFCGSKADYAMCHGNADDRSCWVYCTNDACGANINIYKTPKKAALHWNSRVIDLTSISKSAVVCQEG